MDLNHVAIFVRVVELESFTAAAEQLGLPKSSVSRTVSRLEEDLGVRLLQRTTRKLHLTDAGHAYFERAKGALLPQLRLRQRASLSDMRSCSTGKTESATTHRRR